MTDLEFDQLVREHKDSVYRQMVRVCGHREDAEDALGAALLQAFKSADQLTSHEAFRSWLMVIGRRICSRMRSHPALQSAWDYAESAGLTQSDVSEFDLELLKGCVKEAVDELPEKYKSVYVACEIDEKSVSEVASELEISVAATKSRLLRARTMVRDRLDSSICGL